MYIGSQFVFLTYILIGITVLTSYLAFRNRTVYEKWIFSPYAISRHRQYLRFITSSLIHADEMHLFFNMFTLFFFGKALEVNLMFFFGGKSPYIFCLLYLLSLIVSSIPTYLKHRNNAYYKSLGASGGVSAVIFAAVMFDPQEKIFLFFFPIPGFLFAILYIIYSAYQSRRANDNINHDAHLYGALFGIAFIVTILPNTVNTFISAILDWF